ncbi:MULTISPECIES: FliM/FliN family flagellar motor switch protein [Dyella]|nr:MULTISPECIES: FliM/FliN family flagellar motor switch protein [Dyella]
MTWTMPGLRRIDTAMLERQRALERARAAGVCACWDELDPAVWYVRCRLHSSSGRATAWIRLADWAAFLWPSLADIAWDALSVEDARDLLGADTHRLCLALGGAAQPRLDYVERAPASDAMDVLRINSVAGDVWIDRLDWLQPASLPLRIGRSLPLEVTWELARLRVSARLLERMRVGDVLLCQSLTYTAYVEGTPVFRYSLQEHIVTIETSAQTVGTVALPDIPLNEMVELKDLPVDVSVVLCRKAYTLEELAGWGEGASIVLPQDVHCDVELVVNGRCMAHGELVQVGDRLAVQIHRSRLR